MLRVKFERYWCDYHRKDEERTFEDLTDLENWMFGQMQQNYLKGMRFPTPERAKKIGSTGPWEIEIRPTYGSEDIWIHQITSSKGIVFSDGRFTNGLTHWSKEVQDWLRHCEQRAKEPVFNFAD